MKISIIKFICALSRKAAGLMTAQSGQALPIVLAMVALGTMVTGPFLSLASSSVIGSKVYGQSYNEIYAAGAGVEQAIWQLKYGSLADTIPDVGNSTSYTLSETINNLQPNMTVTRVSGAGGGGQEGTITKSIIDTLQFDTTGNTPVMINVSSSIFAVAYRNASNDLMLKTMAIQADGSISNAAIDSLMIDGTGYDPSMLMISPSVAAIVFRGPSNKGYVATVSIDASGNIGNTTLDKKIFANNNCYEPEMVNVAGSFYAVVYRGPSNKGYVNTLQIAATGTVTNTNVSTYNNLSGSCYEPDIINVTGTYYVVVFRGASNRGNISTIAISTNGIITQSVISNAIFNNSAAYWTKIEQIASGIFTTVYRGPSNRGNITTSSISSNGIINNANINTWVFDSGLGYEPYLIPVSGDAYAIVYRGSGNDGWLKTITINPDGTLVTTANDSYEFNITNGYEPFILHVSGNLYTVAYRGGTGTVGYVITIDIATSSTNSFQIVSTAGETTITSDVLIDNGAVKVLNWQITK